MVFVVIKINTVEYTFDKHEQKNIHTEFCYHNHEINKCRERERESRIPARQTETDSDRETKNEKKSR